MSNTRFGRYLFWTGGLAILLLGTLQAKDYQTRLEANSAVEQWITHHGTPLFYTSASQHYQISGRSQQPLNQFGDDLKINISPQATYTVLSSLQTLKSIKGVQRDGTFTVLDRSGKMKYRVIRGTASDLKPLVAAISDQGVLALGDPVKATIYIYVEGELITETQLYNVEADFAMERDLQMQWVGEQLNIVLEQSAQNTGTTQAALFFVLKDNGREQRTFPLPFAHIQASVFVEGRNIISGYNYDATTQKMEAMIIELSEGGEVVWTHADFGHELAISSNGKYLAALASHELVIVFDLQSNQINKIPYNHQNQASLGLAVNDHGEIALIRVPLDFFIKLDTYFTSIFLPQLGRSIDLQLNPQSRDLFQIQSYGEKFFIGTSYEWLEILP